MSSLDNIVAILRWVLAASFPLAVVCAMVSDFRTLRINNWISVSIFVAFLPAAVVGGVGFQAIAINYAAGIVLLAVGAVLFARRMIGGGDVKLLAAVGVWIGWTYLVPYIILTALIGGVLALAVIGLKRIAWYPSFLPPIPWLEHEPEAEQNIPYGSAIGLAAILLFPTSVAFPPEWSAYITSLLR